MTPKEKAKELLNKFEYAKKYSNSINAMSKELAKQCTLIAVEEILINNCGANTDGQQAYEQELYCDEYFWHDVKIELEKL